MLLMYGATKEFEKADGAKPLQMAEMNARSEVAELLKASARIPMSSVSRGNVGSLRLLCCVHIRKELGATRTASVDLFDVPVEIKWQINYNQPFPPASKAEVWADARTDESTAPGSKQIVADAGAERGDKEHEGETGQIMGATKGSKDTNKIADQPPTSSVDDDSEGEEGGGFAWAGSTLMAVAITAAALVVWAIRRRK